jgi:hypothetical protein
MKFINLSYILTCLFLTACFGSNKEAASEEKTEVVQEETVGETSAEATTAEEPAK